MHKIYITPMARRIHKKNLIVSYNNLSNELKELLKETYPDGYQDYIKRTDRPGKDPIFTVNLETEDTVYMVKFDVKIDNSQVEMDDYKDPFETKGGDEEFGSVEDAIDEEEGNKAVGDLRHAGDFEKMMEEDAKKEFLQATKDLVDEFGDDEDEEFDDEEKDDEDDFEPSEDDLDDDELLKGLDDDLLAGLDLDDFSEEALAPAPKKRGRPAKSAKEKEAKPAKGTKAAKKDEKPAAKAKAVKDEKKASKVEKAPKKAAKAEKAPKTEKKAEKAPKAEKKIPKTAIKKVSKK